MSMNVIQTMGDVIKSALTALVASTVAALKDTSSMMIVSLVMVRMTKCFF